MTTSTPTPPSHYELLGVSYYASPDDVRKGCERRLAALDRLRPEGVKEDLPEQALARNDIMTAYLTLKDGVRRNAYNATLAAANAERAVPPPAQPAGLSNQATETAPARASDLSSSAILREAPIDLREAAQVRDAERIRDRAKRGAAEDAHWAEDATLGVRYVAMILDTMIVFLLLALFAVARGLLLKNATPWYLLSATTLSLITFALTVLYYAWGECGRHRATLGKRMMGLQVVRMDGVTGVGVLRAAVRYGLRLVGSYALLLGYLMAFFTERKQALHDKLTDTVVVSVRAPFASPALIGIGATLAFFAIVATFAQRLAANMAEGFTPAITQALGAQSFDPNRATPNRDDVRLAYFAALNLQRAAQRFHAERGDWPGPSDMSAVVARSEQPDALNQYAPKMLPHGMFALSLGATAKGTAYLLFIPDDDGPQSTWRCAAIRIDADNLPNSCVPAR